METKDIKVKNTLGNVNYQSNEKTQNLKNDFINFLKEGLKESGIKFVNAKTEGDVDFINEHGNYGFAFACSKFDDNFRTHLPDGFKYNDDIVKKVLKKAIVEFKMQPIIIRLLFFYHIGIIQWKSQKKSL